MAAEWIDRASPAEGGAYENRGAHVIHLGWGWLASLHAYLDAAVPEGTLRVMAAGCVEETVAPPVADMTPA